MIKLKNVSKEFTSYKKKPGLWGMFKGLFTAKKIIKKAVDDVSFEVAEGEIVGYIGANGAGKSTTIKIMTGILKASSGEVSINGNDPFKNRKKNAYNIGVVFGQRTQLWWDLPLIESFTILKEIYGVSNEDFKERLDYFKEIFGIDEFLNSSVRTLSLGQRMKADIVASLLHNPKVLFLDEPTIGLDITTKKNVRKAIIDLNKKFKTTVILTTHDLEDIEQLSNRIVILDKGKIIYQGSIREVKDKYGYMKSAIFELKDDEKLKKKIDFKLPKDVIEHTLEDGILKIKFNKHKTTISEITEKVLKTYTVRDFAVHEADINDLVENIYLGTYVNE